ncbi:Penicillin-binding protein 2 [uncultured Desulfobacterium sp.]|uniref:Penicillin-binding protein 2 n=1 Tax=uncultured Desulfobacterium sp. TaxID=201089 RepID=A0A445N3C7_9BACT|nr:Penicillin-binding protein 2 [uncultured Desulfobacterium sp.]
MKISNFDPVSVRIFNTRIRNATLLVLALFIVLVIRLWFLQVVSGPVYRAKSEHNRLRLHDIPPVRGMILDRNGNLLVGNRPSFDLFVIPEDVRDRSKLLQDLQRLVCLDPQSAAQRLSASATVPFRPVCLLKDMSRDMLAIVEMYKFNLPGVVIKVEPGRHYVYGDLAFHLLGYLGEISEEQLDSGQYPDSKPGDMIGKSGVEASWQTSLSGLRGGEQIEVDAEGRKIRTISIRLPGSGSNVCLTIDKDLQLTAQNALAGKKGAIVALDPTSGQVLALASSPTVDPNLFVGGTNKTIWKEIAQSNDFPLQNRALTGQYPPASVFKIIVALAGLEEGRIDSREAIFCPGYYFLGGHRFGCWRKQGHGRVDLHRALVQSCDVYFYQMGKRLGVDRIARYARMLGFGKETGLDIGHEKDGLVPTRSWKLKKYGVPWQEGETISTSIGQSFMLVTPIQMATMISSVFNGGIIYRPQATKWVGKSEANKDHEFAPEVIRKVDITQAHLEIVKKALIGVVNEGGGTGSKSRFVNFTVAGKTGTAQVVGLKKDESGSNKYIPVHYKDHAWFVAVAPVEDPKIAVAIVVEHGGHGGSTAAPIAKELFQAYLMRE